MVGPLQRRATSDYSGQQFLSYLESGCKLKDGNLEIIPLVALKYTYLYLDGYSETGAGALNLKVDSQDYHSLHLGAGFRIRRAFETKTTIFTPELRLRYFYDLLNECFETTATFSGGGTSFKTTGYKPAPSSLNLGLRLEFFNKKNLTLLVDAESSLKEDYYAAGGSLTCKYSF
jgi:outer membrane autotransporter protein